MSAIKRDTLLPLGDRVAPKGGMVRTVVNKTPLSRSDSMLRFDCPICGISFLKPQAWARRTNNHYCCRECAYEGFKIRIEKICIVCGTVMSLTPSNFRRIVTCSRICKSAKNRKKGQAHYRSSDAYRGSWKEIAKKNICEVCSATHGPWVVRGIKTFEFGLEVKADISNARLLCRSCSFIELSEIAAENSPNHIKHREKLTIKKEKK